VIASETITELSVYDVIGKRIWQKKECNTNSETIDLSGLNIGMYLLKIKTEKGTITHKLMKQ
jgi:hypothetical protein